MAIVEAKPHYERLIEELSSAIILDNFRGVETCKQALRIEYKNIKRDTARTITFALLRELYDSDFAKLKTDMMKLSIFDINKSIKGSDRAAMLSMLWGSVSKCFDDDPKVFQEDIWKLIGE